MQGGMTVPELAVRAEFDRHWVRGVTDARGIERVRIGTADYVDAEGCEVVLSIARATKRRKRAKARAS